MKEPALELSDFYRFIIHPCHQGYASIFFSGVADLDWTLLDMIDNLIE